jgi:hypothetical protein
MTSPKSYYGTFIGVETDVDTPDLMLTLDERRGDAFLNDDPLFNIFEAKFNTISIAALKGDVEVLAMHLSEGADVNTSSTHVPFCRIPSSVSYIFMWKICIVWM